MNKLKKVIGFAPFALPLVAFGALTTIEGTLSWVINLINNQVIPLLFAIALLYFLIGVIRYVISGDPTKKEGAKGMMIYGIIGLAVMSAIWGLVAILSNTIGGGTVTPPQIPRV
jgi:uncharacterized membrane protein HdeD (DUF308 family)